MGEWLELEAALRAGDRSPLRMRSEWIDACGPLACDRCRDEILPGELFILAGHCAMGGRVDLSDRAALFSDTLTPLAEHVRCRSIPATPVEDLVRGE